MKKVIAAVSVAITLAACDAPVQQTQTAAPEAPAAEPQAKDRKRPTFANRGFIPKSVDWKNAHFQMPNQQYGNFTYFTFSRLALAASAECNVPLDAFYFERAAAIGRRSVFQDKQAREAVATAQVKKFQQDYGPFDPNDSALLCRAVERNKADKTLFGALFF